jgi:hypothetical protein
MYYTFLISATFNAQYYQFIFAPWCVTLTHRPSITDTLSATLDAPYASEVWGRFFALCFVVAYNET